MHALRLAEAELQPNQAVPYLRLLIYFDQPAQMS